ncbi:MAG: AAA family ATPase [Magnetococcales bacterium]|nr:AAA family ATPase [Magnetococcales bacterium]
MIIRSLHGENIMKYANLDLTDLPERGVIAIQGRNESGKSTLAEAICLALFGRTSALAEPKLDQVIRWGESSALVSMSFTGRDDQTYKVTRYIDREGEHKAHLSRNGESEPFMSGWQDVNRAMIQSTGLVYERYLEALYLVQRRGGQSGMDHHTLKALAGVDLIEKAEQQLQDEQANAEREIVNQDRSRLELLQQRRALDLKPERLDALQNDLTDKKKQLSEARNSETQWTQVVTDINRAGNDVQSSVKAIMESVRKSQYKKWDTTTNDMAMSLANWQDAEDLIEQTGEDAGIDGPKQLGSWLSGFLEKVAGLTAIREQVVVFQKSLAVWMSDKPGSDKKPTYQEERKKLEKKHDVLASRKRMIGLFALLFLIVGIVGAGGWGLHDRMPEEPMVVQGSAWVEANVPHWKPAYWGYSGIAGGGCLFLGLLVLGRSFRVGSALSKYKKSLKELKERARESQAAIEGLQAALDSPLEKQILALGKFDNAPWRDTLSDWQDRHGEQLLEHEMRNHYLKKCQTALDLFSKQKQEMVSDIDSQISEVVESCSMLDENVSQLDEQIAEEKQRREQDSGLNELLAENEQASNALQRQIEIRQVSRELLTGTARRSMTKFHQELQGFLSKVTPMFTEDRYQQLRIDDELLVQAFSVQKNDFLGFEEVSTGVQHQMLLALRVALAQAVVARSAKTAQFLIFDEPFAFFDRYRTHSALKAFEDISPEIAQIWVISQEFDEEFPFAARLSCDPDSDVVAVQS